MQLTFCHALLFGLFSAVVAVPIVYCFVCVVQRITKKLWSYQSSTTRGAFAGGLGFATCAVLVGFAFGQIEFLPCGQSDSVTHLLGEKTPVTIVAAELPCGCDK